MLKDIILRTINHPLLRDLSFNLEIFKGVEGHREENKFLRGKYKQ